VLYNIAPLYHYYDVGLSDYFGQFVGHNTGLGQTIKIKMMNFELVCFVYLINCKCRAGDFVATGRAARQAAHEGSFASAEIADQLDYFTAL
jgi:hypothetical protein